MSLKRIDIIALNGATGEHYKYEEIAKDIVWLIYNYNGVELPESIEKDVTKILVENFPNDNA